MPFNYWLMGAAASGLVLASLAVWGFVRLFNRQAEKQVTFFEKKIREEMRLNQAQFLQLAKHQFTAEQSKATTELETRKQAIEGCVQGLKEELTKYQKIMHDFEQDRTQKYGNIENELKNASLNSAKLQETTNQLKNVLGNVKLRGQWGERMAEDIIRYAGLIEGINYKKQKKLDLSSTKPDFTFLLPNHHKINMDVKFPLDNYTNMVNTEEPLQKESYRKEFIKNVKERIKEIQNRNYINPSENTLDFVLLFIPNEQVFALIQEKMPGIFDAALRDKVVLCSPFTLYAMLSVIRQAFENFRYEKDIKKIIQLIEQFTTIYDRFKDRFEDIGKSIDKLETQYRDLRNKSFKQLDTKIRHIDDHKKGQTALTEQEKNFIDVTSQEPNVQQSV